MGKRHLSAKIKAAANQNLKERDYWLKKLSGQPEKTSFPYDYHPQEKQNQSELPDGPSTTHQRNLRFPDAIELKLIELSKRSDYVLHIYLTAGLVLLLHKYTGRTDILIGTPIYKQDLQKELLNQVLVLRNQPENHMTVKELLLQVKQTLREALEHQNYPIEMLPEQLNLLCTGTGNGFPLFDTAILLENIHDKKYLNPIHHSLTFSFTRKDGSIAGTVDYAPQLYREATIKSIVKHFIRLMTQALAGLDSPLENLEVFSVEEKRKIQAQQEKTAQDTRPQTPCQEKLALLWSDILKIEKNRISLDTNFFKIGGHSLKASILITRIQQEFDARIPLTAVFTAPTIRTLANVVTRAREEQNQTEKEKYTAIEAIEKKEYYVLSSAQVRLFILDQQGSPNTAYNMASAVKITGSLHIHRLEQILRTLVRRHESLRTSFHWIKGEPVQIITRAPEFKLEYHDLTGGGNQEQVVKDFIRPFDLSQAPLFRSALLRLQHQEHVLLVDMHHIISDGTSMDILVREFAQLYAGVEFPPLRIQYRDFSQWEKRFFQSPVFIRQEKFWQEYLKGELPQLQMPLDFKRPGKQTFAGNHIAFTIPAELTEKLNKLAQQENITLNILFLSLYSLLLSLYTNQEDIFVASVVSGRNHAHLENIIGMFGNSLPLRNQMDTNHTFLQFLAASGERILAAYENQDYPLEKMIDLLNIPSDPSRNPIFDTMLAFHNELSFAASRPREIADLEFTGYSLTREAAKLDFKMDVFIGDRELECAVEYNTHLFKEETIRGFIRHFQRLLQEITANPDRTAADMEIFTGDEQIQLNRKRKRNIAPPKKPIQVVVSATFTAEPAADYIRWWGQQFHLDIDLTFAPYNQVFRELLDQTSLVSTNKGINLLLIRFEDWLRDSDPVVPDETKCSRLEKNFQDLTRIIKGKTITSTYLVGLFPVSTLASLSQRLVNYLENLNRRWKRLVEQTRNVYLLDFTSLSRMYQVEEIFDAVMDREGHLPFSCEFYAALGTRTAREICALTNSTFKVIVLDCDNTLWKGICGEDGPLGVNLDPPYLHLQRLMLKKHHQGMLLTLCSKNNQADVREVFTKNPGMLLKKEHFVDRKINWQPKSENIRHLAAELNLGLDSFIFIDDSPLECAEVMNNCPEVLTLQLPRDPELIPPFLEHVWALDKVIVTPEDKQRTHMYQADKKRKQAREHTPSLTDYLRQLELKISFNTMKPDQVSRVSQLTQRTNQFNLSTIRRNENEITALCQRPTTRCWVVEVRDRFGDYGLVGVVITLEKSRHLFIDTFLLSCRVMGRTVEDTLLAGLKKYCQQCGLTQLQANYYPTPKNKPLLDFLQRTWKKKQEKENHIIYSLDIESIPAAPEYGELYYNTPIPNQAKEPPRAPVETGESQLHHIAIATADIRQAVSYYQSLGYTCGDIITDPLQKAKLVMCHQPGFDPLELVSAVDNQSPTAFIVEQNGDIPYHLCYRVRDIRQMLTGLEQEGIPFEVVNDAKPAVLFHRKKVIFIQVRDVGLVEFLEDQTGDFNVTMSREIHTIHCASWVQTPTGH